MAFSGKAFYETQIQCKNNVYRRLLDKIKVSEFEAIRGPFLDEFMKYSV